MKILYIFLIFIFSINNVLSNKLDSLYKLIPSSKPDQKIKLYKEIVDIKFENLDYTARYDLDSALRIANSMKDEYEVLKINIIYGSYYKIFGEYDKALKKIKESISYLEKTNYKKNLSDAYLNLADTYRSAGFFKDAIFNTKKALRLSISIDDSTGIARANNRLAAIQYEYIISPNDTNKRIKQILNHINQSFKYDNSLQLKISNYNILGAMYLNIQKNYDSAKKYLLEAYNIAKLNNIEYDIPIILINLAWLYRYQKEYKQALNYALETNKILSTKRNNVYTPHAFIITRLLYQKLGDYKKAYEYSEKSHEAFLNIFDRKKDFSIAEFNLQHKILEKQKDLELSNQRNYYIAAIGLITITLLLIIIIINKKHQKLLKEKNNIISDKNKQLEELNKTKDKFFSIIAHDLKNPIHSYKDLSNMIVTDFDNIQNDEKKELLKMLTESAAHTSELLENLLQWSRSQRGTIQYEPIMLDLNYIIKNIINLLKLQSQSKNIEIIYNEKPNLLVEADNFMVHTIIRNLISNSMKFTPAKGKIKINCQSKGDKILISVEDTGVGIPKEKIPKIFNISERTTTLGTNKEEGTGLGLILCKEFVEKHGSKLIIESEVGKGTRISFELPKAKLNQ